ncbi:hypothetical protein Aduo_015160 [Ancylostoma duodenale]
MARLPSNFLSLDQEPKVHGPPPAYRSVSGTVTETDTWSDYSGSSGLGKRRGSWVNLVESDENLNRHKVNCYPKVKKMVDAAQQAPSSRASSQLAYVSDNYQFHLMNSGHALPLKAAPGPAGTLPPSSVVQSRAPSVVTAPAASARPSAGPLPSKKRNRLQEWKDRCKRPCCALCIFFVILLITSGIITAIVLSQVLKPPKTAQISWLAPEMYRGGQNNPVRIEMKADDDQVRLQMQGAMPFKGNYISYYDFKTNRVAVIDETLKSNGKSLACFVMPLDRSLVRDADAMRKAAGIASHRTSQTQGWGESWNYLPAPVHTNGQQMFTPPIPECEGARWIQLEYAGTNQKNRKCSDCYDFCLPDYGIERDAVRGEEQLNIVKRICFYLFVPEWRTYAQANTIEQNQRDFETYYRNRNHLTTAFGSNGGGDSKWITLQQLPQTIQNVTGNLASQLGNAASGAVNTIGEAAQGFRAGVFGQNSLSQPNYQNGNGNGNGMSDGYGGSMQPNQNPSPSSPGGFPPAAVNGVMNLNGVNGQSGNNAYNMNPGNQGAYGEPSQNSYPNMNPNMNQYPQNGERQNRNSYPDVSSMSGYSQSPVRQIYGSQRYENQQQAPDQRDTNSVPYTNGNGFGMGDNFNNRPAYPDANGVNPPSGYVPQAELNIQGVAGMPHPRDTTSSRNGNGYTPDIMPNLQYQQQQQQQQQQMPQQQQMLQQQQIPQQRWRSGMFRS